MFCPSCGVKNEGSPIQCFVCKKTIPSLEVDRGAPARHRPRRNGDAASERFGSVGDRMLALLLDRAVIVAIVLIVAAAMAEDWRQTGSSILSAVAAGAALVTFVFLYHLAFELAFGTTPGKAVMGLQVRNEGDRSRIAAVAIRNALRVVDALALYVVGFLTATFTRRRQRFGDLIAGTVVMEMPMSNGARAAMMVLWSAMIVALVWIAAALCPTCGLGSGTFSQ